MACQLEKYEELRLRESLSVPCRYAMACKELGVILRYAYSKSPKSLQSLLFDHTLFAFRLLPQMQTQSAVSAANLLIQSAESALPKQKRTLAATEFKQAKIAYKRRNKVQEEDRDPVNLPQDVLVHIFSSLDIRSLVTSSLVCRSWNVGANDSYLWWFQYTTHFGDSESTIKTKELPNRETGHAYQRPSSDEVCNVDEQCWKDTFRRAYLGLPSWRCKVDRGYCLYCRSVVWLSKLKCPNQHPVCRSGNFQLKPLSPVQISKYIADENEQRLYSSDSDSEPDEEFVASSGIWTCIRH